jgi:copper transport protein
MFGPGDGAPLPGGDGPGGHQADDSQPGCEPAGRRAPSMRDLRLSVAVEVCVVALVLAVTAVLVNTATGRESYAPAVNAVQRFDTGGPGGAGTVDVAVTPARLGGNRVTLTFDTPAGRAYAPAQAQVALFLPARNIGPLPVTLSPAGRGRYQASAATFSFTGQWQLRITIRSDAFDETTITVPVTVHQ